MSKITYTKLLRMKYFKDGVRLPPLPTIEKECPVCKKSMYVADGTIQIVHSSCKKEYKRMKKNGLFK